MEKNNYEDLLPVKVLKVILFVLLFQKQKKQTNEPLDTGKLLESGMHYLVSQFTSHSP